MVRIATACLLLSMLAGCVGFRFGPGYASDNPMYFAEPPVVVMRGERAFLRWPYGEMGFFFAPDYAVREGALWFSLQGTSSSGNLHGREREMEITGRAALNALRSGGAFWWEPDGSLTELEVVSEPADWPLPVETGEGG